MLQGLRVLDLTDESGWLAGKILGDMGADVIKIEPPGGDNLRQYPSTLQSENRAFLGVNRSKQGVVLDLKNSEGLEVLLRLVELADVPLRAGHRQRDLLFHMKPMLPVNRFQLIVQRFSFRFERCR